MVIAFQKFNEIQQLPDAVEKHRAWLKDYEELCFSVGKNKNDLIKWQENKEKYIYSDNLWQGWSEEISILENGNWSKRFLFANNINKIQRHKKRLIIEFDDEDVSKIPEHLQKVKEKLKKLNIGFIVSSHKGKSDYIWVEFTRDLTEKEAEKFLNWIAPKGSEIDINFSSDNRRFPILFAEHWKYPNQYELPIEYFEGEQIDYDKLNIKKTIGISLNRNNYKTFLAGKVFGNKGQGEIFNSLQPIFYDRSETFWLWDNKIRCWKISNEVDILNMIEEVTGEDIISSRRRNEIITTLKQQGRKNIPKSIKSTWIQFQDIIYDVETGEKFEATPEWFVTNPIPYKASDDASTPTMDKLFGEWVGKEYVDTLYEIVAYCLLPDYPIHRLFCFVGAGLNGKSCFLNLLKKFIGRDNCTSTELDTLLNSRFEITKLHKKLVCTMGETDFSEITKTSIIKRLTGGDLIGFEYKNKTPFDDSNYAKILIATNNLPATNDKSIGFYRRWLILDFPNQFTEEKNILDTISEQEYNNLAMKSIIYLNNLLIKRGFTKEGTIEERTKKFEDRSNPLDKFIREYCNIEDPNSYIFKYDFEKKFNQWCKENRFRNFSDVVIGKEMKERGFIQLERNAFWLNDGKGGQLRAWIGIKWK